MKRCRSCRFCVIVSDDTGICHGGPPGVPEPDMGVWPPVHLDRGWCGVHARHPWWRRLAFWMFGPSTAPSLPVARVPSGASAVSEYVEAGVPFPRVRRIVRGA